MTRTDKFFLNATSSLIYQFITILSGLIIPRTMLVAYGSEINGLVSSITQFISYFSLVEAGLAAASVYALYRPLADDDKGMISAIVCESKKFYYQTGYIFVALVVLLSVTYPFLVNIESFSRLQVCILTLALGASLALNYFLVAKYRVLLTADQKNYILNALSSVGIIVYTVIVVVMTKIGVDIVALRVIAISYLLITPAFLYFYMKKHYSYVNYKATPSKGAIKQRWDALIIQILGTVHTSFPVVIATIFTSLSEVSVYSIYNMVVMGVQQLMGAFSTGLAASFGEIIAKKEYKTFEKAYDEYEFLTYFLIVIMLATTLVLIQPFIDIYTRSITDANYHRPVVSLLFVINAVLYCVKSPQGSLISSAGLFKDTKYQTITQALIAIVFGLILVKPFGIVGILIGLILSNIYRDIDLLIYIPKKIGYISIKKSFLRVLGVFVQIGLIYWISGLIRFDMPSLFKLVLYAIVVFVVSLVVCFVFNMLFDRKALFSTLNRFKGMVMRKVRNSNG